MCLAVNAEWLQYLIGAAKQLMLPSTWGDMRDPAVQAAQAAANDLIALLCEAPACGGNNVAGTYAQGCLAADVTLHTGALTDVVALTVEPGDYELVAQATLGCPAGAQHFIFSLWDGDTLLSQGEATTANASWWAQVNLTANVSPTVETVYTLRAQPDGNDSLAKAAPNELPGGAGLTTCLRAYPQGITGPQGVMGNPGPALALRFTNGCVMQSSQDGGVTWVDVPGWDANAPTCFAGFDGAGIPIGEIDPGAPPNVQDTTVSNQACNIAEYLATTVLKGALNEAQRQANLTKTALDFGVALLALIPGIDIAELGFVEGANILYQLVDGDNLADFTAAASDDALWAAVVCAIYGCIHNDGEVNAGNFDCVTAALGAITYAHTEVPTALALFWAGLGLQAVRAAQIAGALGTADCTACGGFGAWCTWWESDQRDLCNGDWVGITGGQTATPSTCGGGVFSSVNNGAGGEFVVVQAVLPFPRTLTCVRVDYNAGALDVFSTVMYDASGAVLFTTNLTNWTSGEGPGPIANVAKIVVTKGSGNSAFYLGSVKVGGPDSGSPWGESNGVCD